jgi:hypothetical protein
MPIRFLVYISVLLKKIQQVSNRIGAKMNIDIVSILIMLGATSLIVGAISLYIVGFCNSGKTVNYTTIGINLAVAIPTFVIICF